MLLKSIIDAMLYVQYFLAGWDKNILNRRRMASTQWMWIDKNCYNSENTYLFHALKAVGLRVSRFDSYQAFADSLIEILNPADPITQVPEIKVICSSTLCDTVYKELQNLQTIKTVVVYCYKLAHGLEVMSKYQKVVRVFTKDDGLINFLIPKRSNEQTSY